MSYRGGQGGRTIRKVVRKETTWKRKDLGERGERRQGREGKGAGGKEAREREGGQ